VQRRLAVGSFLNLVPIQFKLQAQHVSNIFIVFNDENPQRSVGEERLVN